MTTLLIHPQRHDPAQCLRRELRRVRISTESDAPPLPLPANTPCVEPTAAPIETEALGHVSHCAACSARQQSEGMS